MCSAVWMNRKPIIIVRNRMGFDRDGAQLLVSRIPPCDQIMLLTLDNRDLDGHAVEIYDAPDGARNALSRRTLGHTVDEVVQIAMPTRSPSLSSSRLKSLYSRRVPLPLVRMPQPDIMMVPLRMLVMVAGKTRVEGLWVVTPIYETIAVN